MHRLVLGRGSDVAVHGQVRQERFDLGFGGEKILARPHAVESNELYNPLHLGSLGMHGVVGETAHLVDVIEKCWLLTSRRARHIQSLE